jgi:alpha-aminoadipic semialdehyde synthase
VPLTPAHVARLVADGVEVRVQPSARRIFADVEFAAAGATLSEDLSSCNAVLAIKEIPSAVFVEEQAYMFFAHVIKGQPYNMPMLARMLERRCTLIDYEKVCDDAGRRLIAFGRFAGLAGMIDTLWALHQRLTVEGLKSPFGSVRRPVDCPDLESALDGVRAAAAAIDAGGLAEGLNPLVLGFIGYGNVSRGAQEVADVLGCRAVAPEDLPVVGRGIYKVEFEERHIVAPLSAGQAFALDDYYRHPERYRGRFFDYVPHLHVVVNGSYWDARYPRFIRNDELRRLYLSDASPRLRIIGDLSCDIEGGIEATSRATTPADPVFTYDVQTGTSLSGVRGHGPTILAVDILPAELPRESSQAFGDVLLPFAPALAKADFRVSYPELALPPELHRAVIAHRGELAPAYLHLAEPLRRHGTER